MSRVIVWYLVASLIAALVLYLFGATHPHLPELFVFIISPALPFMLLRDMAQGDAKLYDLVAFIGFFVTFLACFMFSRGTRRSSGPPH